MLGGLTIYPRVANFLQCTHAKNYENWLAVDKVIAKIIRLTFLAHPVCVNCVIGLSTLVYDYMYKMVNILLTCVKFLTSQVETSEPINELKVNLLQAGIAFLLRDALILKPFNEFTHSVLTLSKQ